MPLAASDWHQTVADRRATRDEGPLVPRYCCAMRISLLHATYRSGRAAVTLRDQWIAFADDPTRVEHLFACNADDEISMAVPEIAAGVVGEPVVGAVTAVRNWNAAAAVASGDLLVVIADDLLPARGWDAALEALCRDLVPAEAAFVIKVRDHETDTGTLMRHPVLSRRYYEKFGLWHSEYDGYLVDNDFTWSARRRNLVIDGRSVVFNHRSPGEGVAPSVSHRLMWTTREAGESILNQRWPTWKRRLIDWPLDPKSGQTRVGPVAQLARGFGSRLGYLLVAIPERWRSSLRQRRPG